jgi:hypothetical protein
MEAALAGVYEMVLRMSRRIIRFGFFIREWPGVTLSISRRHRAMRHQLARGDNVSREQDI